MPKPDYLGLTVEDVLKEIDNWPSSTSKHKSLDDLDEEQRKILCALMRSGKKMVDICRWWKAKGWAGASEKTMRTMYKALVEEGY
jgi:hypothetical protein